MRVTFVLPSYEPRPNGGFKVVYEHANRLTARGHSVTLVHPWTAPGPRGSLGGRLKRLRFYLRARRGVPWFRLAPQVDFRLVRRLEPEGFPESDAMVATGWRTAEPVSQARGAGFYLIQSFETWDGPEHEVEATWKLPLHKLVIARWLERLAAGFGEAERTTYVPNAIDPEEFFVTAPIADRPARVGMLWHRWAFKGAADGLAAIEQARERVPALEAIVFGTAKRPAELPAWIEYVRSPVGAELRELYNGLAVFLHPSHVEGWPLPPAEAMTCGCALVAAANEGVGDYAVDGESAALAAVGDPAALGDRLASVLADRQLRERLAEGGRAAIARFTWEHSVSLLEEALGAADARRR
jgi:glycosyltransferase involved in cell wall biosynthesis